MSLAITSLLNQLKEDPKFDGEEFTDGGLDKRFLLPKSKSYTPQFSQIYFLRLASLKANLLDTAKRNWATLLGT